VATTTRRAESCAGMKACRTAVIMLLDPLIWLAEEPRSLWPHPQAPVAQEVALFPIHALGTYWKDGERPELHPRWSPLGLTITVTNHQNCLLGLIRRKFVE
jgi:hypothetical protein